MNRKKSLIIIGAGGHALAILDVALSQNYDVAGFVDMARAGQKIGGIGVRADISDFKSSNLKAGDFKAGDFKAGEQYEYIVALGDNARRQSVSEKTRQELTGVVFATLRHATAYVSPLAKIEAGCVIMGNAFVGPNCRIGEGCLLNTGSQIDHDGVMANFSSLGPKACLGGTVRVGQRSAISIGATVKHGVNVGDDCILAAQAYLHNDMPAQSIFMGVPASLKRVRDIGEKYL